MVQLLASNLLVKRIKRVQQIFLKHKVLSRPRLRLRFAFSGSTARRCQQERRCQPQQQSVRMVQTIVVTDFPGEKEASGKRLTSFLRLQALLPTTVLQPSVFPCASLHAQARGPPRTLVVAMTPAQTN